MGIFTLNLNEKLLNFSFLHLLQVFVPNARTVYGSGRKSVTIPNCRGFGYSDKNFAQVIHITKTHVRALDQPSQRCSSENKPEVQNTSACIARFIEDHVGCNTKIQGSQYSRASPCRTNYQLLDLKNLSRLLEGSNENDIYDMTGCLSSCEKDQYQLISDPIVTEEANQWMGEIPCELHLQFRISDSSYREEEQYMIYDIDSFVADIGGYMGLLLGSSLMSIYMALEAFVKKRLRMPIKEKIEI